MVIANTYLADTQLRNVKGSCFKAVLHALRLHVMTSHLNEANKCII